MIRSGKMQKERKDLLCYFLVVSKAQHQVQKLQQKMILYLGFNPVSLYKKISSRDSILTEKKLKLYLLSIGGVNSSEAVQSYLNKHQLIGQISCDQFIESILPYTPDVLRNVKSTILWQIQAAKTISDETELYYHDVVRRQIFHILRISAFKHKISPQTWTDVKKFILADIQASAPLKQKNYIQNQTCNFMIIRKWLEIWLHVSEYQILNIMRWFRGQDEKNIQRIFSCVNVKEIKCTCNNEQIKGITDNTKRNGYFSQIKQKEEEFDDGEIMEIWCEYVFTIINSEKEMQEQRKHFGNYVKEIKDILKNEVISKKKSFTSVTKLINVIEKYMRITPSQLIRWKQNLSNLLLDNSVINTLFFQKPFPENPDQANVLKPSEQKLAMAQLLKTFCETKSKLVTLSLKIKANNVGKRMFQLLKSDKSYTHITRKEIVQILQEMEAVCEQSQIDVLMKHFGNGKIITQISFCNVFHIQSNQ